MMKYGKEILALKSLMKAQKEILREYESKDMEQIITETERRIESLERVRDAELAEQQSKLAKAPEVLKELFRLRYVKN